MFDDLTEWPPICGLSEDECKLIFCDGIKNTLQTLLCEDSQYPACNIAVECDPRITITPGRRLPGLSEAEAEEEPAKDSTNTARALSFVNGVFSIQLSFGIACADPQCTNESALALQAAAAVADLVGPLSSATQEDFKLGIEQALASIDPQSVTADGYFTNTFTFSSWSNSDFDDPTVTAVPQDAGDVEFVGVGECVDSFGRTHAYAQPEFDRESRERPSPQECISACQNTECLTTDDNVILRGIVTWEARTSGCACDFDGNIDGVIVEPDCPIRTSTGDSKGAGPIISSNGGRDYLCFRLK